MSERVKGFLALWWFCLTFVGLLVLLFAQTPVGVAKAVVLLALAYVLPVLSTWESQVVERGG